LFDHKQRQKTHTMTAWRAKTPPLVVANARHGPSHGCVLRLDPPRFPGLLGHAGCIYTF